MASGRERDTITDAGHRRVEAALERYGLLLVQGQDVVPSLADLLANRAITTRGYSWDYAPAWRMRGELSARADVAVVKLLRGKVTLVHQRLWPATHVVATAGRAALLAADERDIARRVLAAVEAAPPATAAGLATENGFERGSLRRSLGDLERWCCVLSREREDLDYHTHEQAWYPWAAGKVARGRQRGRVRLDDAIALLGNATQSPTRAARLFPVVALATKSLRDREAGRGRP